LLKAALTATSAALSPALQSFLDADSTPARRRRTMVAYKDRILGSAGS
jgi:hypothetical protein